MTFFHSPLVPSHPQQPTESPEKNHFTPLPRFLDPSAGLSANEWFLPLAVFTGTTAILGHLTLSSHLQFQAYPPHLLIQHPCSASTYSPHGCHSQPQAGLGPHCVLPEPPRTRLKSRFDGRHPSSPSLQHSLSRSTQRDPVLGRYQQLITTTTGGPGPATPTPAILGNPNIS